MRIQLRRLRRQWRVVTALAVLAAVSSACGKPPDLEKELGTVQSWTATARLADDQRGRGAISRVYARQIRDRAAEALGQERQTLEQAARSVADRARARAATDSLAAAIRGLDQLVGRP